MTVVEGAEEVATILAIAADLTNKGHIVVLIEETGEEVRIGNQEATHMIVRGGL